jgi:hypothetical protein
MPRGIPLIHHGIEAAGVPRSKSQSPSTLQWRLGVELWRTCRFETTATSATRADLMDSRRTGTQPPLRLTPMAAAGSRPQDFGELSRVAWRRRKRGQRSTGLALCNALHPPWSHHAKQDSTTNNAACSLIHSYQALTTMNPAPARKSL